MENIKIECSWASDYALTICDCEIAKQPIKMITYAPDYYNRSHHSIILSKFNKELFTLFANNLYVPKYPNLIIIKIESDIFKERRRFHINILDSNKNEIIFSSKNIIMGKDADENDRMNYSNIMIMDNFMIIEYISRPKGELYERQYWKSNYIIYYFETQKFLLFKKHDLHINNDKTIFLFFFQKKNHQIHQIMESKIKILSTCNIYNIAEIEGTDLNFKCICNNNIIIYTNNNNNSTPLHNYYDIKKQKIIYSSKNRFIGWRGDRFIEYDDQTKKCNLISFIDDIKQPEKIKLPEKNCIRCLEKYIPISDTDEKCSECNK